MANKLEDYRKKIDAIDEKILDLLDQRGKAAQKIGQIKHSGGKAIHVPSREKKIYQRLTKLNKGPYKDESLVAIFREIISATRSLEAPLKVSFLGPEATFTHMAAEKYFGSSTQMNPASSITQIFMDVERGHADYGVVPIENSTEGVVNHTLDMFADSTLQVCAEVVMKIRHHLLSDETSLGQIQTVYSHPHALAQCRDWLSSHLPHVILKETESTAQAAKKVANTPQSAAIASEISSNVYKIPILEKSIQDQNQNFTRFLVLGQHMSRQKSGEDKTSILFTIKDESGGLYSMLGLLAKAKINLSKIESRPLKRRPWEYMFFLDLDGHIKDTRVSKVLNGLEKKCIMLKVLGSYPKSRLYE